MSFLEAVSPLPLHVKESLDSMQLLVPPKVYGFAVDVVSLLHHGKHVVDNRLAVSVSNDCIFLQWPRISPTWPRVSLLCIIMEVETGLNVIIDRVSTGESGETTQMQQNPSGIKDCVDILALELLAAK
jgi:hypothetical protein